jgi:integrase
MTKQGNENTGGSKRRGRRTFGSIRRLPSGRWQARYPDSNGRMLAAPNTFLSKADAARYLALVEADITRNVFLDPSKGRTPFKEWSTNWFQTLTDVRPTTRAQYDYLLGRLISPRFEDMPLATVDALAVRAWMADLEARPSISPTTAAKAYRLLRRIMAAAVEADYIAKNPCTLKRAGVERSPEMRFATPEQVNRLVRHLPDRYRAMILVAAYGGLRWGELANLRRRYVDLRRGEVDVVEQLTELAGRLTVGPPKSTAGRRTVTLPASVLPSLREHLERWAEPGPDGLVFPAPEGGFLRHSNFRRRVWLPATRAAGLQGLRFHDLRHTAATLAVVAGATTKELMARMGHSTPAMAIRYQHVMEGRDAFIASALDRLIQTSESEPNGTQMARRQRKRKPRSGGKPSEQRGNVVPWARLERATYCLGGSCSIR